MPPVVEAHDVTVRFGGLVAVDAARLEVRRGEITALIGPNGAGKTTLFNAINGLLTPSAGRVSIHGRDVTRMPVHARAQLGLARTFQVIQLFGHLSVYENLLVATHVENPTGVLSHLAVTRPALLAERTARRRVREVVSLLGLEDIADRPVHGLPFGTLRMVELGRALVASPSLLMLDEPASGLDTTETDGLVERLLWLRENLDLTILLIEHDVRMVADVSDYVYVLDRGRLIADGHPDEIRRDHRVVTAYLGNQVAAAT